jgi:hypothetical protein
MITSFFKTSKPIHYIIFIIVLTFVFSYQRIIEGNQAINLSNSAKEVGYLFVVLASFVTLVFIVTKNNLTHKNSFAALYFCLFIGLIPSSLEVNSILISNLFVVFSLRRIISLRTKTNIKKKLFDASMWICLAATFEPWAILFFGLLFMGILFYSVAQIKNILIPFLGVLTVVTVLSCFQLLTEGVFPSYAEYLPVFSFETFNFNSVFTQGAFLLFLAIILVASFTYVIKGVLQNRINNPNFLVLILAVFLGIAIMFLSAHMHLGGYLFAVAPSAIIVANFSETTKYRWLSELVIGLLLLAVALQFGFNISSLVN